jgi:hypothetical protein
MSARFLPVSNTFIEVLLWLSDMAECRDIARSAARHRECRRLPKRTILHLSVRPIERANGL